MEMKKVNAGKLRAIGYDERKRILRVELDGGNTLEYSGIGEGLWRNFKDAGAQWSFYRDNIEEEFTSSPVSTMSSSNRKNPLDDLFK